MTRAYVLLVGIGFVKLSSGEVVFLLINFSKLYILCRSCLTGLELSCARLHGALSLLQNGIVFPIKSGSFNQRHLSAE